MSDYKVTDTQLTRIADAIRSKAGLSSQLAFPSDFISAVQGIPTGSGVYISKTITSNGEYNPADDSADAFSHVTVSVPTGSSPVLVSKTISSNGTYNPSDDSADAYSQVVVDVPSGGSNDNFLIAIGVKSGSVYDNETSFVGKVAFYCRNSANGAEITGVEMTSAQSIGQSAFYMCSQLETAIFPVCKSIYASAFCNCAMLSSISFPECEHIGMYCFSNCAFSECSFPMVISVGNQAFQDCKSLKKAYFQNCNNISTGAFQGCTKLESIYLLYSSIVNIGNKNVFVNTPISASSYLGRFGSIYVPSELVSDYKTANVWSNYSDRITSYVEE